MNLEKARINEKMNFTICNTISTSTSVRPYPVVRNPSVSHSAPKQNSQGRFFLVKNYNALKNAL